MGEIIIYDLNGASKNNKALTPQTIITITWSIFFKSWTIIAIKVRGIANFKPNSSGTNEPNIIPANVEICQQTQSVLPVPIKW